MKKLVFLFKLSLSVILISSAVADAGFFIWRASNIDPFLEPFAYLGMIIIYVAFALIPSAFFISLLTWIWRGKRAWRKVLKQWTTSEGLSEPSRKNK